MNRTSLLVISAAAVTFLAGYSFGLRQPTARAASTRIYELRTYHCFPGKLPDLMTRFRDHTMTIFERHGMHNVVYFLPNDEPMKSNTLVYLISHDGDKEKALQNWKEFSADPEWKKVAAASEANGKIVEKVDREFLNPTDFSPMK